MEENEETPYTWAKLKEFCNSLTDEQLQQTVFLPQDDESSIEIKCASELGEDMYYFPDIDYQCIKSDFDGDCFCDNPYKTFEEAIEKEEYVIIPGTNVYLFD